jgi:hypothetical protein
MVRDMGCHRFVDGLWIVHVMVEDVVGQQALAVHLVARRSQVKPDRALFWLMIGFAVRGLHLWMGVGAVRLRT